MYCHYFDVFDEALVQPPLPQVATEQELRRIMERQFHPAVEPEPLPENNNWLDDGDDDPEPEA